MIDLLNPKVVVKDKMLFMWDRMYDLTTENAWKLSGAELDISKVSIEDRDDYTQDEIKVIGYIRTRIR